MLDLFVMIPSIFAGAALWLIFSLWTGRVETSQERDFQEEPGGDEQNALTWTPTADALAMLDVFAARYDPPVLKIHGDPSGLPAGGTRDSLLGVRVRCNCGLEFPEDSLREHSESTGHSKPFDQTAVRIAKIWDLEEAVIETASPDCVKCGKPVPGLRRIGKTIYVTHLGCTNGQKPEDKPPRLKRKPKNRICSICWKAVDKSSGITRLGSVSGQTLVFHNECLDLNSRPQLLIAEEPSRQYRRTSKR